MNLQALFPDVANPAEFWREPFVWDKRELPSPDEPEEFVLLRVDEAFVPLFRISRIDGRLIEAGVEDIHNLLIWPNGRGYRCVRIRSM